MSADVVDLDRLNAWSGLDELPGAGPVQALERIKGGAQNLLFTIRRADGTELVLRRPGKHFGDKAVASFAREARVLGALAATDVPHPQLFSSCLDDSVIGAPFSILRKVGGFTPRGPLPGRYGEDEKWRRAMAFELIDGAARLAAVDPGAIGLGDLSRTGDWPARQITRYLEMLRGYRADEAYRSTESPLVEPVAAWLQANLPTEYRIGIVHGDFQFANVMFEPDEPALAAIVDWEMAGLGDPLLDLAWILTAWRDPGDPPGSSPQLQPWSGMPERAELVAHYATRTGRDCTGFRWYEALAYFRLAALLEGSYVRSLAGAMNAELGAGLHKYAAWLWTKAEQVIG